MNPTNSARYLVFRVFPSFLLTTSQPNIHEFVNQCGAQGIIIVYSVASERAFKELQTVLPTLPKLPTLLIGNKLDIPREVTTEAGQDVAEKFGYHFLEITAKTKEKVDEAFDLLINKVKAQLAATLETAAAEAQDDVKSTGSCVVS